MITLAIAGLTAILGLSPTEASSAAADVSSRGGDSTAVLVGEWVGGIEQNGVTVLRLRIEFTRAASGEIVGALDSPDQGARGIAIAGVSLRGDSVEFAVPTLGAAFRGILDDDGARLAGTWTQGPTSIGMALRRGSGATSFARPQDPQPPFPYVSRDVTYVNDRDGTVLAGTLTLPEGIGPFPAALLLSGSGAQDRDGSIMGHRPFRVLADYLTRRGIAVLRVDDRGVGGSTGDVMSATLDDNAADAAAGLRMLRADPAINPFRIGLIGHSEGGWLAPIIASRDDRVAFVVLLAGPAVDARELLLAQTRALLETSGDSMADAQVDLTQRALDVIRKEPNDARAAAALREARLNWLATLPSDAAARMRRLAESPEYQAEMRKLAQLQTSRWFRALLAHDPAPALEALRIPLLALYAERDLQVPPRQSVPVLRAALADHRDATIEVLPGLNHLFQTARTGLPAEYAQIEESFAPAALQAVAEWILRRYGG